jgi:hypothetical protein
LDAPAGVVKFATLPCFENTAAMVLAELGLMVRKLSPDQLMTDQPFFFPRANVGNLGRLSVKSSNAVDRAAVCSNRLLTVYAFSTCSAPQCENVGGPVKMVFRFSHRLINFLHQQ